MYIYISHETNSSELENMTQANILTIKTISTMQANFSQKNYSFITIMSLGNIGLVLCSIITL